MVSVERFQGANTAAAAAKLGYPTYSLGHVGTDSNAPSLQVALAAAGVNLDHLRSVPGPSGTAVILLQPGGERCSQNDTATLALQPWL